ncbi:EAL domain-containing protein [Vibrio parahaemolyticus]|nr:EAL domain-containing protein [Vibrio parahaemolyticus]EII3049718.1 EAL domain-containing protein [Vibrio parahaemolyticus]EIN5967716.1 EAL domain-containing protein [Vibrio parahaemolyticus]EKH5870921.1 EAL domain-containing protein [Vibrio parahaemolyticus]ELA7391711.1 EAL domain-containing protein [Vibrio parahaemolyticus]
MFRFAIPSPLMTDWQHALQQCCDATQAQGQLYTLSYTKQWLSSEVSTSPQNHRAIVAMIEQNCAQFSAPHFDVVCSQFDDENLSLCPVWLPNEELFAVVTLTHSTQQKQTVSAWLSALAGRISFDVSQHYHQELKRHHSHANKPLPTLQEFIDCLDDHIWIKTTDGLYAMTNRSVEQAWKKSNDDIVGKNDFDLFSAERAEKFIDADRLVVATGTQNIVEECRQIDENNNPTWLETIKSPVRNQAGDLIGILGMTRNITRRKMVETQLSLASKIFNNSQEGMVITDSMGHFCGDQLLSKLAVRLQDILHLNAHVARIGGDEFVIVLPDIDGDSPLLETLSSILGVFRRPFDLANHDSLRISTSIGIALYPNDGQDSETLLKNADTAMYLAKKNGRNGYAFYSPDLTDKSVSHVRIQSALHEAIEKEQLHLVYQPQYNLAQNAIIGVEALVRWEHPEFGLVPPADFIPIAEKTGLIQNIGEWVLKDACLQGTDWLARGVQFGKIAVNVSALQLQQSRFINKLKTILRETGFPAHRLELEITESFLLIDPKLAIASLNQLCELGIEISLDDFGTGYSSLSYLKGLPINKLKIDRSFVSDVPNDNDSNAIVNAIIAMGTTLSLKVVAEGIETPEQVAYLVDKGCIYGQGYLFSPPVAAEKLFN